MNSTFERYSKVQQRIEFACQKAGRTTNSVNLLAVGKQHPARAIAELHSLGQRQFGENRLAEAREKQLTLGPNTIEWHFIGTVQSRKTREIAEHFDWVQSVDREKILTRLSSQRPENLSPLNICIQVNIDEEPQKSGAMPAEVDHLATIASNSPGIRLRGLMCIPRITQVREDAMCSFSKMGDLMASLKQNGHPVDTLSMGMSADLEWAIEAGSTMVRIGTDLFGPRTREAIT